MNARRLRAALVRGAQVGALSALFAAVLVLVGRGPWNRWVLPVVLLAVASVAVEYWRNPAGGRERRTAKKR